MSAYKKITILKALNTFKNGPGTICVRPFGNTAP